MNHTNQCLKSENTVNSIKRKEKWNCLNVQLEFVLELDEMIPKNSSGRIKIGRVQKYFQKKSYAEGHEQ